MRSSRLVLVLACLVAGCSGATVATGPPTTSETTVTAGSPSPAPVLPTAVATAASGPVVFESTVYPYSLTMPGDALTRKWHPASRQWNGTETIDFGSPFEDLTGTVDGGMFVLGQPWTGDVVAFSDLVTKNVRSHACMVPTGVRNAQIAGDPAIVYRQICLDQPVLRLMLVGHAFGLAVSEQVAPGTEDHAIDDLLAWFDTFAWRA